MSMRHSRIFILIPAYNPDENLIHLVTKLKKHGYQNVLLINDGSTTVQAFQSSELSEYKVIHHDKNEGKGAALKTGFKYIIENYSSSIDGIITVDADGQHLVEDIIKVEQAFNESPKELVLGTRQFDTAVPLRSAFGNKLTSFILKSANNIDLEDTQTGLRAIPIDFARQACNISGNRYEFELECLILAKSKNLVIRQVEIQTVYLKNNETSHFNPIADSIRIYSVFARFIVISLLSFLVDIALFWFSYLISSDIYISTYTSRFFSSCVNFAGNKYLVFESKKLGKLFIELIGYIMLVALVASTSAFFVNLIYKNSSYNILAIKIAVDTLLFFSNYLVQKHLLFNK